jgi:ribosomal protein S1
LIKTNNGFVPISTIKIGDKVLNRFNKETEVLGVVQGELTDTDEKENKWSTGVYEWLNNQWKKTVNKMKIGDDTITGMYLITDSGEFTLLDEKENRERHVRDFTEIGYDSIHETYSFVASRLRITKPLSV